MRPGFLAAAASQPALTFQVVDYGDADALSTMAEAVLAVAPLRFALAGHSMGGRVALEVVRLAPSRVQKLKLMNTGYLLRATDAAGDAERAGRTAPVNIAKKDGVRAMCAQWVKGMVHPDRLADAALIETITAMFARKSAERFAHQQHALLTRADARPVLSSLSMPCLLLCGRQDSWPACSHAGAGTACAIERDRKCRSHGPDGATRGHRSNHQAFSALVAGVLC